MQNTVKITRDNNFYAEITFPADLTPADSRLRAIEMVRALEELKPGSSWAAFLNDELV